MRNTMIGTIKDMRSSVYGDQFREFTVSTEKGIFFDILLRDNMFHGNLQIGSKVECGVYTNLYMSVVDSITEIA